MPKHVQPKTVPLVIYDDIERRYVQYDVNPQKSITVEVDGYPVTVDVGSKGALLSTKGAITTQRRLTKTVPSASDAAKVFLYRKDHMQRAKQSASTKKQPVSARPPSNLQRMTKDGGRAKTKTKAVPKPPHEATKRKGAKR